MRNEADGSWSVKVEVKLQSDDIIAAALKPCVHHLPLLQLDQRPETPGKKVVRVKNNIQMSLSVSKCPSVRIVQYEISRVEAWPGSKSGTCPTSPGQSPCHKRPRNQSRMKPS